MGHETTFRGPFVFWENGRLAKILTLPERFTSVAQDYVNFEPVLEWFDWSIRDEEVSIDFRNCKWSNYQALALLLEYVWFLRAQGCTLDFWEGEGSAWEMWSAMGAKGWSQVLNSDITNFEGSGRKPLLAIRGTEERQRALLELE